MDFRDVLQYSIPSNLPIEESIILIEREPNEERLPDDVVFGDETPEARIGRVIAVIAHHPVVVHLKAIRIRLLTVDVDFPIFHLQIIAFIDANGAFIDRQVVEESTVARNWRASSASPCFADRANPP